MKWSDTTDSQKEAYYRRYKAGENIIEMSLELDGMNPSTLSRYLRLWANTRNSTVNNGNVNPASYRSEELPTEPALARRSTPSYDEIFSLLKSRPYSLDELCSKYDRSKPTIQSLIEGMKKAGYVITEEKGSVSFNGTDVRPTAEVSLPKTLADMEGQEFAFAACSDAHAGSAFSQPTNRKKFIEIAYHEYGVRHIMDPGDITTGVGGYRGQEYDLIPQFRAYSRSNTRPVTEGQIWLADAYTPKLPGLTYYKLGGNHDYWHVVNSGIDAVARLCHQRDDMVYLGYDVADIPLTDRVDIRLWHPAGGVPYALSYRLQKAMEQTAFEELSRAVNEAENPRLRILLAGHMHIEVKFHRGPMFAAHVGCFEGQTNYLKRKGLFPQLGGSIFKVRLSDSGLIQRVEYTFIPFTEILDDWQNWPVPPSAEVIQDPDDVPVLFKAPALTHDYFQDERAA